MKKTIPLALITHLDKVIKDSPVMIKPIFEDNFVVTFKEKNDTESPFYFRIESINVDKTGVTTYTVEYLPENVVNLNPRRHSNSLDGLLKNDLKVWLSLLIDYNKPSAIFDDLILQKYYDEISLDFEISDEDANYAPHSFNQQASLIKFLDISKSKIQESTTERNKIEADDIIKDIEESKELISKSTKVENVGRVRKILAKICKFSFEIGKELLIQFTTEAIKSLGSGNIQTFLN